MKNLTLKLLKVSILSLIVLPGFTFASSKISIQGGYYSNVNHFFKFDGQGEQELVKFAHSKAVEICVNYGYADLLAFYYERDFKQGLINVKDVVCSELRKRDNTLVTASRVLIMRNRSERGDSLSVEARKLVQENRNQKIEVKDLYMGQTLDTSELSHEGTVN